MTRYEYKVVPAPRIGVKAKGVKTADGRLAVAVEAVMNEMGAEGWSYLRSDTLPLEERSGFTGKSTTFQHLLVFCRPLAEVEDMEKVAELPALTFQHQPIGSVVPEPVTAPEPETKPAVARVVKPIRPEPNGEIARREPPLSIVD